MPYRLLRSFESLFQGRRYLHRNSTQGDHLSRLFFEDLAALDRSDWFRSAIETGRSVVNGTNRVTGIRARRGDGTFGELLPGVEPVSEAGFAVMRGPTANVQIGIEVKVLGRSMIKQIDRVANDLRGQAAQFRLRNESAIAVGIVGVNHATRYVSYEGDRAYTAEGRAAPAVEGPRAIERLQEHARPSFDEFAFLRFDAENAEPFGFRWVDLAETEREYGATLLRVLRLFETRYRSFR